MKIKIDEAIALLQEELDHIEEDELPQWFGAVTLGIEALKNKKEARKYGVLSSSILLPSETEE